MAKLEKQGQALKKIEATQEILLDIMRSSENATKPEGWPNLPLRNMAALLDFELLLNPKDNYALAVSSKRVTFYFK